MPLRQKIAASRGVGESPRRTHGTVAARSGRLCDQGQVDDAFPNRYIRNSEASARPT